LALELPRVLGRYKELLSVKARPPFDYRSKEDRRQDILLLRG
jgi:hypothetical protein